MKPCLMLLLMAFMAVAVVSANTQPPPTIDEQLVTNACFDKLFQDMATMSKDYKYQEFESDRDESLRNHKVEYKEKLYEYRSFKDVRMRRLMDASGTIDESIDGFRSFDRDFNINRSFFDRFKYTFKQRNIKNGVSILVFQFSPKPDLIENHQFDRVVDKLIGELEIRESDSALLVFRASLPKGDVVKFFGPPIAGGAVQLAKVVVETADWEGLTLPTNIKIDVDYSASLLLITTYYHHTKVINLKKVEKIKVQDPSPAGISSDVSKDHELSDDIWTRKRMVWYLIILGLPILLIILLSRTIKKKRG